MLVSTNRTRVQLVAGEPVRRAEGGDPCLRVLLLRLEPGEVALALRERSQVVGDECAQRGAPFGGADPCRPIDVIRDRDGDVLHVANLSSYTVPVNHGPGAKERDGRQARRPASTGRLRYR